MISKSDLQIGDIIHFEDQDGISGKSKIISFKYGIGTETIEVYITDSDYINEEEFNDLFGIDGKEPCGWMINIENITEVETKALAYDPNQIGDTEDDI